MGNIVGGGRAGDCVDALGSHNDAGVNAEFVAGRGGVAGRGSRVPRIVIELVLAKI